MGSTINRMDIGVELGRRNSQFSRIILLSISICRANGRVNRVNNHKIILVRWEMEGKCEFMVKGTNTFRGSQPGVLIKLL